MHKDLYGSRNWTKLWSKLEQQGNVGLDYCINPVLYPKLTNLINRTKDAQIVDFGSGTNIYGIQYLFGYEQNIPALLRCNRLARARQNVKHFTGLEQSSDLVQEAKKYLHDLGYPSSIGIKKMHLVKENKLPFLTSSVDIATSRNFIMHLSDKDLAYHLAEVKRILKRTGTYLFAVLNPEYEFRKYKEAFGEELSENERYSFMHGSHGENGIFYHYYKSTNHYEALFKKYFKIKSKSLCVPISNSFKKAYPRYFWKNCPMAFVYELTNNYDK